MSYTIVEIFSDESALEHKKALLDFCILAGAESKHDAAANMQADDWENNTASLLFLIYKEKRFKKENGGLFLLYNSSKIVAVSGFYRSDFSSDIFVLGVRTWVLKEHRHHLLIANYLLPRQIEAAKKLSAAAAVITFNDSTKSFAKLIERSNKNPEAPLKFFFGDNYPDLYKDMRLWPHPVKIKNVKQWILIKVFSPSFHYDWTALQWAD